MQLLEMQVSEIIDARVEEFKKQRGIEASLFDIEANQSQSWQLDLYSLNEDCFANSRTHAIPRFKLVDFGSTRLGVESADSDLDLLVTTYDCLFERLPFFHALEAKLK